MENLAAFAKKLQGASIAHAIDPHAAVIDHFPAELDRRQWFVPPELISLYGTATWESLDEAARMRLSFHELVNLFCFTLFGERVQVEGLASRLYRDHLAEVTPYLHFFLSEENNHMTYFGTFCERYAGKFYPPTAMALPAAQREYATGEEDFLFFVKLLLFEEIGDPFNVAIATDERVPAFVRELNLAHHKDEARHLAFGREMVKMLWDRYSPAWGAKRIADLRVYLNDYLLACWWEFYNMAVYRDAGIAGDLFEIRETAFEAPGRRELRKKMTSGISKFLVGAGILETEADVG